MFTRKTMYCHITTRHVRATIVAVEKQLVLHTPRVCVCSLRYPARNAHAPYFHVWPLRIRDTFQHYLKKGTIFEKVIEYKMFSDFLYKLCLKHFSFYEALSEI